MTAQAPCPDCGTARVPDGNYCEACGTKFSSPLLQPASKPLASSHSPTLPTGEQVLENWLQLLSFAPYLVLYWTWYNTLSFSQLFDFTIAHSLAKHVWIIVNTCITIVFWALSIASFGRQRAFTIAKSHLLGISVAVSLVIMVTTQINSWVQLDTTILPPYLKVIRFIPSLAFSVPLVLCLPAIIFLGVKYIGHALTRELLPPKWSRSLASRVTDTTADTTPVWQLIGWWAFPFLTYFVAAQLW